MRRPPDVKSFLAHLPLFQGLRGDELERLASGSTLRRLRRGETLFRQGEPSTGFHAVVQHLSRILRELTRQGLVEVRGRKLGIPDAGRLREWLNGLRRPI